MVGPISGVRTWTFFWDGTRYLYSLYFFLACWVVKTRFVVFTPFCFFFFVVFSAITRLAGWFSDENNTPSSKVVFLLSRLFVLKTCNIPYT